jgi:hypothetical protein
MSVKRGTKSWAGVNIRAQQARRTHPVVVTKVAPIAWRTAVELAHGDPGRLYVTDRRTVYVLNGNVRPAWLP